MEKLHLETQHKNLQKNKKGMQQQVDTQTKILGATFFRKVQIQSEISITSITLQETKWLFEQYGQEKPGWLRRKFTINQRRRKMLNDLMREAQLDKAYCCKCSCADDWAGMLHILWHQVNEVEKCL